MLLKPQAEKYFERLSHAKESIQAIRHDLKSISSHMGEVVDKLKTPTPEQRVQTPPTSQQATHTPPPLASVQSLEPHPIMDTTNTAEEQLAPDQETPKASYFSKFKKIGHTMSDKMSQATQKVGAISSQVGKMGGDIGGKIGSSFSQIVVSAQGKVEELTHHQSEKKANDHTPLPPV